MSPYWSHDRENLVFGIFEARRPDLTLPEIAHQAYRLLRELGDDGYPSLKVTEIMTRIRYEARMVMPKSKNVPADIVKLGFGKHFSVARRRAMRKALQDAEDAMKNNTAPQRAVIDESQPKIPTSQIDLQPASQHSDQNGHPVRPVSQRRINRSGKQYPSVESRNVKAPDTIARLSAKVDQTQSLARKTAAEILPRESHSTTTPAGMHKSKIAPIDGTSNTYETCSSVSTGLGARDRQNLDEEVLQVFAILQHHNGQYAPSPTDIAGTYEKISEHISTAIIHLLETTSFSEILSEDMSEDTLELVHVLIGGSKLAGIRERAQALVCSQPRMSKEMWLSACTSACIFRSVFLQFDDDPPDFAQTWFSESFRIFANNTPSFYRKLRRVLQLNYLEHGLRPKLDDMSRCLTQKLLRTLSDLHERSDYSLSNEHDNPWDLNVITAHFKAWETNIATAFQQALRLRLDLACSPYRYRFVWPISNEPFSRITMTAVDRDHGKVLLCLQPLITSYNDNLDDASASTLIRAKVVLV